MKINKSIVTLFGGNSESISSTHFRLAALLRMLAEGLAVGDGISFLNVRRSLSDNFNNLADLKFDDDGESRHFGNSPSFCLGTGLSNLESTFGGSRLHKPNMCALLLFNPLLADDVIKRDLNKTLYFL